MRLMYCCASGDFARVHDPEPNLGDQNECDGEFAGRICGAGWPVVAWDRTMRAGRRKRLRIRSEVKSGGEVIVAVRLMNKKTGKTVPDAVIFAKRIDMAPDGMAEMKEPIEEVPSTEPGLYRFKTTIPMAGRWRLSLGAKVQGETGTVESKLVVKAAP
jgi:hypothetical protein